MYKKQLEVYAQDVREKRLDYFRHCNKSNAFTYLNHYRKAIAALREIADTIAKDHSSFDLEYLKKDIRISLTKDTLDNSKIFTEEMKNFINRLPDDIDGELKEVEN